MERIDLEARIRKERAREVRTKGFVPAIVYGKDFQATSVEVDEKKLLKIFKGEAGRNVIINLIIKDDGTVNTLPVITHDIQKNFITDKIMHVDFLKIVMTEEIKTRVRVELVGEPAGAKDGGILVHSMHEVEVKCLPGKIPEKFEVDVSPLKIGDILNVIHLTPPEGVEILNSPEDVILTIAPPAKEEVVAPPAVEVAPPPAPVAEEARKEGEEEEKKPAPPKS